MKNRQYPLGSSPGDQSIQFSFSIRRGRILTFRLQVMAIAGINSWIASRMKGQHLPVDVRGVAHDGVQTKDDSIY